MTEIKRCCKKGKCIHPEQVDGGWLPKTANYFPRNKRSADGLDWCCKACRRVIFQIYEETHPAQSKMRRDRYRKLHPELERERSRKYRETHLDKVAAYQRGYKKSHPGQIKNYTRRCYQNHRTKNIAHARQYRRDNPEKIRVQTRQRYRTEKNRVYGTRRRARKRGLPYVFTPKDWNRALDYFNNCCAICERQLKDLFGTHTASADHWIPLASPKCPGTVPTNMLPLCHGVGGCNNRKGKRDPLEFLETEFGKRRAVEILSRIDAYFEWVKSQGGD